MQTAPRTICVGTFDGVHRGHAAIVRRARELTPDGHVVVLAFDPHPGVVLRSGRGPGRLTTFERRAGLLRSCGADEVERLEPTPELLDLSPGAFIDRLHREHPIGLIVEGRDFRFGRGREGDMETLRRLGRERGFLVEVVDPVEVALCDQSIVRASSTLARRLLGAGRVRDVAAILGRAFELEGEVVAGDRRGRRIGFPTANLRTGQMLPGDGVYAGWAVLADGRREAAAVSVGTKPMFDSRERVAEAHLPDAPREGETIEGLPEYGWSLRLEVVGWIREQMRFASVGALVAQMHRDCARAREILRRGVFDPWCARAGGEVARCR